MFTKILIPLDMSATAEQTLGYVKQFIWSEQTRLILVSVVDQGIHARGDFFKRRALFPDLIAKSESAYEAYLEEHVQRLREAGYRTSAYLMHGDPAANIIDAANKYDVDLIAMAPHGSRGIARAMLGSVSDKVIRATSRPVLLVRKLEQDPTPGKVTRILVPLDGSVQSKHVLSYAKEIAHERVAEIVLLRSVEPMTALERTLFTGSGMDANEAENHLRSEAESYLHEIQEELLAQRFRATYEVHLGSSVESILDAAKRDIDLIVMSTHGLTDDNPWTIGSVTTGVLNSAPCPILIERQVRMTSVNPTMMSELASVSI